MEYLCYYFDFNIKQTLIEFHLEGKNWIKYWDNYRKAPTLIKIDYNEKFIINCLVNFYFVFENVINFNKNICIINEKDIINII